jgi:SAM-dependent methyltransferase
MSESKRSGRYEKQHRGTHAAYESYFAGMDASMQQKVALTTAHFPIRGRIADMGSGSGRGTFDLASLYRGLELVGVDINPVSIERSREQYRQPNLSYAVGDISEMVFPEESLDGILDSSVLHHVTSFNNFDVGRVHTTLDNQVAQLKPGGVIIIRDFVIPEGAEQQVRLDLPLTDGAAEGSTSELSTAALFELFARDWRSSVNRHEPLAYRRADSPRSGFARYELSLRAATEFVLRKDYRADWETEILEEYTYLSQAQFEAAFRSRGLRLVISRPLWNPWIVRHRFEGKFHLADMAGNPLPFPPTNYLIVGEKVRAGDGVELVEDESQTLSAPAFLSLTVHRHRKTGRVFELVERPHQTIDLLPWYESEGQVFVLAKKDFPRPIVNACAEQPRLNRSSLSGYITEPISAIVSSTEDLSGEVSRVLEERAGLSRQDVLDISEPFSYYTSPGGVNERVLSWLVKVTARRFAPSPFPNYTKFKAAGAVREMDATQVLRASHVGGMFDARIEINIYHLLRTLGHGPGPWIGAAIALSEQPSAFPSDPSCLKATPDAAFEACAPPAESNFLTLKEGLFVERAQDGATLSKVAFEYVLPANLSISTVVALPVIKSARGLYVGIELRDLPAVQSFQGSSRIAAAPAWRLPRSVEHCMELPSFLTKAMRRDFHLGVRRVWELGGSYLPTAGVTPEIVYPFLAEVEVGETMPPSFHFVEINDLEAMLGAIQDGHLLITAYRLIHALERPPCVHLGDKGVARAAPRCIESVNERKGAIARLRKARHVGSLKVIYRDRSDAVGPVAAEVC